MKIKNTLRFLAIVAILTPGIRLLAAASPTEQEQLYNRSLALDLLAKDASETSDREARRSARKQALAKLNLPSAASFDLNHDRKLDEREIAAWATALRAAIVKSPAALKHFDLNHDGKLDDAEWLAAFGALVDAR